MEMKPMQSAARGASALRSFRHVLGASAYAEMVRIDAERAVARVQDAQTVRYFAHKCFVGCAVGANELGSSPSQLPIALDDGPIPYPASVFALIALGKEPVAQRYPA